MNRKVSLLLLSVVLAIIVFCISTYLQKRLINFVPTIKCMIAKNDIEQYEQVTSEDIEFVNMPIEIIANTKIVQSLEEVNELFLKDKVYKGQLILADQFDSQEKLNVFKIVDGNEKVSIKIKNAENAVSYILKKGSKINVYATVNTEYANSTSFESLEKQVVGKDDYGYTIIKILSNVEVLATFTENGEYVSNMNEKNIDTILLSVTPEDATRINLIRDIASFNVTEL